MATAGRAARETCLSHGATLRADAFAADDSVAGDAWTVDCCARQKPGAGRVSALNGAQAVWAAWRDGELICAGLAASHQPAAAPEYLLTQTARRALSLSVRAKVVDGPR